MYCELELAALFLVPFCFLGRLVLRVLLLFTMISNSCLFALVFLPGKEDWGTGVCLGKGKSG